MTADQTGIGRRRARTFVTLAGVALAIAGIVSLVVGLSLQDPAPPEPPSQATGGESSPADPAAPSKSTPDTSAPGTSTGDATQSPAPEEAVPELGWSKPVRVSIPTLDVTSTLEDLTLDDAGAMTTPVDPDLAGWFSAGPPPGLTGASVIAGHVTWNQDPAVFFRLGDLRSGDRVSVEREDGVTAVFEVTRIDQFDKDSFPTQAVYGQTDHAALRLITCGGTYDESTHTYADNVIVWAHLVAAKQA